MLQRKWSVVLAAIMTVGAACAGGLAVLPETMASANPTNGVTVAGGNGAGSAANQLDLAGGVWVDNAGNVYVATSAMAGYRSGPPVPHRG